jgi:4-phosphopantoate--beta-alanine ligase
MTKIPKSHPRCKSLITREKLVKGIEKGIVHQTGLIAHGRGEAFDYLLGEKTIPIADRASKTAAAYLLLADDPVISVNGNVAALAAEECVQLAKKARAKLEVNLFHRTQLRVESIADLLRAKGAKKILGERATKKIPGLEHDRSKCSEEGIYRADVVLVPLEDGDRCEALKKMGKIVIAIDLNALSRTARMADVTIVDELTRALPRIGKWIDSLKFDLEEARKIVDEWDNEKCRKEAVDYIANRLKSLFEGTS